MAKFYVKKTIHESNSLLLEIENLIDSKKIFSLTNISHKNLSLKAIANLKASYYWLKQCESDQSLTQSNKIKKFLESSYHLRQVEAWELASQILFIQSNNETELILHEQLGHLGLFREQLECWLPLLGKINLSFDCICLKILGDSYTYLCEYKSAIKSFENLLHLAQNENNLILESQALEGLGLCYFYLGQYKIGFSLCQQSLNRLNIIHDYSIQNKLQQQCKILVTTSYISIHLGKNRQACNYAKKALVISREINDQNTEWYALVRLANSYSQKGQHKKAFKYLEPLYSDRNQIKDVRKMTVLLTSFSVTTCSLRKLDLAIEALREGMQLQRQIGDTRRQYHLQTMLGYVYLWNEEYFKAISCLENCVTQSKRYGYLGYYSMSYALLSYIHSELGNIKHAHMLAKKSLAISMKIHGSFNKAASFSALSLVYFHQWKIIKGVFLFLKVLVLSSPITSGDSKLMLSFFLRRVLRQFTHRAQMSSFDEHQYQVNEILHAQVIEREATEIGKSHRFNADL